MCKKETGWWWKCLVGWKADVRVLHHLITLSYCRWTLKLWTLILSLILLQRSNQTSSEVSSSKNWTHVVANPPPYWKSLLKTNCKEWVDWATAFQGACDAYLPPDKGSRERKPPDCTLQAMPVFMLYTAARHLGGDLCHLLCSRRMTATPCCSHLFVSW